MENTRTLISSSIISIVIVVLGMFMLCMSRAPRINIDEPLVEGGGIESDSAGVDDQNFLSLLNEANEETASSGETTTQSSSDDDSNFLSQLENEDQSSSADGLSSESGDEGMDEILRLLESDEESNSEGQSQSDMASLEQELSATESPEGLNQDEESEKPKKDVIDNLNKDVEQLERVLADKTTQVENLRSEINEYDQKITSYQSQKSTSRAKAAPVQSVSYQESTPMSVSNYDAESSSRNTFVRGDYEATYNSAMELFQNHQFQQAIDVFYQLLEQDSNNPLADNCQYWLGECRFAQGKFHQALVEFNKVFAFDTLDKQDDAQLMLGLTYMKLGEVNRAQSEFDWLVTCYGASEYVQTAHRYLGSF